MVFDSSTTRLFNRISSSTPNLVYFFKLIRRLNIIPKFRETLPSLIMGEIHGHDLIDTIATIRKWDVTVTETGSINTTYFSMAIQILQTILWDQTLIWASECLYREIILDAYFAGIVHRIGVDSIISKRRSRFENFEGKTPIPNHH